MAGRKKSLIKKQQTNLYIDKKKLDLVRKISNDTGIAINRVFENAIATYFESLRGVWYDDDGNFLGIAGGEK